MRPNRLVTSTDPVTASRPRRGGDHGNGPRRPWRRVRLAATVIAVAVAGVIAAAPAVAGAATAHHSVADNGVINSRN